MSDYSVTLTVNDVDRTIVVAPQTTLLDALRWELGLTGTKKCCAEGECGACTVLVNERAVNSCLMLAVEADGANVVTIEGLEDAGGTSQLQDAFMSEGAIQCGFCIPGMVMAARALLLENPDPTESEVREALSGNLCRCGGYQPIVRAVRAVASPSAR